MGAIVAGMLLVLSVGFVWELEQQKQQARNELKEKAKVIAQQLLAVRAVIAASQDRINYDSQGNFEFKHLNPAAVIQRVARIFNEVTRYQIKQTRMVPRIPENEPDAWERQQMVQFSENPLLVEVWGEEIIDGVRVFRYMIPLYMQPSCVQCHGEPKGELDIAGFPKEGYKVGELAGAISINVPMDNFDSNVRANIQYRLLIIGILVLIIVTSIYMLMRRLVTDPLNNLTQTAIRFGGGDLSARSTPSNMFGEMQVLAREFNSMASRLQELYSALEDMVEQRTRQLSLAYEELKIKQMALHKANDELSKANKYKSQFFANMSHELRTPLTAILAFAELLLNQVPGKLNHEQREYLTDIYESGHQLMAQINDILDFAKVEAGRMSLRLHWFRMEEVVESIHRMFKPITARRKLDFIIEVACDLPAIRGDQDRIRQVLINLVGNAVKFTPEGGMIAVRVGFASNRQEVLIEVADTGIGIRPEDQEIIFEEFIQADGSSAREYPGTGLGLALAKHLVEMHGGRIWVESTIGNGSTFFVALPLTGPENLKGEVEGNGEQNPCSG